MASDDRIEGYASAVFEIARSEGELERVGDELYRIARSFEASAELRDALTDRRIPIDRKLAVLGDLLDDKASALSVSIVNFIVGVGRRQAGGPGRRRAGCSHRRGALGYRIGR